VGRRKFFAWVRQAGARANYTARVQSAGFVLRVALGLSKQESFSQKRASRKFSSVLRIFEQTRKSIAKGAAKTGKSPLCAGKLLTTLNAPADCLRESGGGPVDTLLRAREME
jgi:hypothetical protein